MEQGLGLLVLLDLAQVGELVDEGQLWVNWRGFLPQADHLQEALCGGHVDLQSAAAERS